MSHNRLTKMTDQVKRIEHCGMYVDLVATSRGTVRVGSMPDIAKFLSHHGFREEIVVVPVKPLPVPIGVTSRQSLGHWSLVSSDRSELIS